MITEHEHIRVVKYSTDLDLVIKLANYEAHKNCKIYIIKFECLWQSIWKSVNYRRTKKVYGILSLEGIISRQSTHRKSRVHPTSIDGESDVIGWRMSCS